MHSQSLHLDSAPTTAIPLRTGVPFPQGQVAEECEAIVCSSAGTASCQIRPLMLWPDRSVQWALVDWVASPGETEYELEVSESKSAVVEYAAPVKELQFGDVVGKLSIELADGRSIWTKIQNCEAVDSGVVRNSRRLQLSFVDENNCECLRGFLHVHTFEGFPQQRWSLTLRNFRAAEHPGGIWELGDANSVLIKQAAARFSHVVSSQIAQGFAKEETEWRAFEKEWRVSQFGSGGENYNSAIHRDATGEIPIPFKGYRLNRDGEASEGRRMTPSLVLGGPKSIGFYCERFWENFPHALAAHGDDICFDLLPGDFGATHELQPGEQKTYEFWLAAGEASEVQRVLDQLRDVPAVALDPDAVCKANVIPHLSPESNDRNERYLELVRQAIDDDDSYFAKREVIDMYGWRHFGDVWGDHEAVNSPDGKLLSPYNNQYDMVLGLGIHSLRSGNVRFRELMHDLARHVTDIDIYHTSEDRAAYNHGQFWHTVHYVDAGLSTHRSYPKGTCGGGPSSGQAYSRGLLLHYCLTGDETSKEVVIDMARWMIAAEDGSATKYRFLAGGETGLTTASGTEFYHGPGRGPANAVEVLVTAFQLTHKQEFLKQADHVIRRVVHPDQSIEELDLANVEDRWFYTMFLQAIGRYLDVKQSHGEIDTMYEYARRVLVRFADWMVEFEYPFLDKPEVLEYPNETWSGQEMRKCESLQWAAKYSQDKDQRARFLEKAQFFFDVACEQLSASPRRSLCRPVVLLLTNGYSRSWFQERSDTLPNGPIGPSGNFPESTVFVDQKQRAIGRAKKIAGAMFAGVGVLLFAVTYWGLSSVFR